MRTILLLLLCAFLVESSAQRTKTIHRRNGSKTTVHTGRRGNKTVVHKGKAGRKTVVRKSKTLAVVHRPRRRVRRTRVVHHHYRHLPRRGVTVATVHRRATVIRWGGVGFRLHAGVWYRPMGKKWVVARAPIGVRIRVLPKGYRKVVVGPRTYFYYYGVYYQLQDKEYVVVDAPMGAEVDSLPDGYHTEVIDGKEYYVLDDVYYMPSKNDDGEEILVATSIQSGS